MENVTIQDVADAAGVSITTVSRVLNNNYPVSAITRQKVEKAINHLEFTPNVLARGLIQKKTYTIGVLIPSISNLFFPNIVEGIRAGVLEKGYQILMCDTGGDEQKEIQAIQQLYERQVDGIISVNPRTVVIESGRYEKLGQKIPLILINGANKGMKLNYVLNDQEAGANEAMQYLLDLGHEKIAFIRGGASYSYDIRQKVYYSTLESHGIRFNPNYLITIDDGNSTKTPSMAMNALTAILSGTDRVTAILCCNDWMAVGALYAAQNAGLNVPGDLSIVGNDNTVLSEITMPKLTTVDQNMHRLGLAAANQLLHLFEDSSDGYLKLVLDTKLVIRESCAINPLHIK